MTQPDQQKMNHLGGLLTTAATPSGDNSHKRALDELNKLKGDRDYFPIMAYLFGQAQCDVMVRMQAGLQLKNNMNKPACAQNETVQQYVIGALTDSQGAIRNTAATAASQAVFHRMWPLSAVETILGLLQGKEVNVVMGALTAVTDILEDCVEYMVSEGVAVTILRRIMPFLGDSNPPEMRLKAIHGVSVLLEEACTQYESSYYKELASEIQTLLGFVSGMLSNAARLDDDAVCYCIRSINFMLVFEAQVENSFDAVVDLMKRMAGHSEENVRKEAIEFWKLVHEAPRFIQRIEGYLPDVIPSLIRCMVLSEEEQDYDRNADRHDVEDKAEDIKPKKGRARHRAVGTEGRAEDNDDDEVMQNTQRAVAGLALDTIACKHAGNVLNTVLTTAEGYLNSQSWQEREAGIMVLGSVAEGCFAEMIQYLPDIMGALMIQLKNDDNHPLIHSITCWTISSYAGWFDKEEEYPGAADKLQPIIEVLLTRMMSQSKKVQAAAASALSVFCSTLYRRELENFAPNIIQTVNACLYNYQLKNRYVLFEVLDDVCGHLEKRLAHDDCVNILMEPLLKIWEVVSDDSPMLYPYFRCMSGVCAAIGETLPENYAVTIFKRPYNIARNTAGGRQQAFNNANMDLPDEEFLITSLDLLSGLSSALGSSFISVVQGQGYDNFVELIGWCVFDKSTAVRQQILALIGDLCTSSPNTVQSLLPPLRPVFEKALKCTDEDAIGECSNTAWILNDLLANQIDSDDLSQCLGPNDLDVFFPLLCDLVINHHGEEACINMAENAAVAIGRCLLMDPGVIQRKRLTAAFVPPTLVCLNRIQQTFWGKEDSVKGLFGIMESGIPPEVQQQKPFFDVLDIAYGFDQPSNTLAQTIAEVLKQYKNVLGNQWTQMTSQWDQRGQKMRDLRTYYNMN